MFFYLRPRRAYLSDLNSDLIRTYRTVRRCPIQLTERLQLLPVDSDTYYALRDEEPTDDIERALRFLYLNRAAFGGVYRLNQNGRFNVPFGGRSTSMLWTSDLLCAASRALKGAELEVSDFEMTLARARSGDVVFCDPTYTVAHDNNGFVRYNERNFSWSDQLRLAECAKAARAKGATVIISNAHHESVRTLYRGERVETLSRPSGISRLAAGRRQVQEYLFVL